MVAVDTTRNSFSIKIHSSTVTSVVAMISGTSITVEVGTEAAEAMVVVVVTHMADVRMEAGAVMKPAKCAARWDILH